MSTVFDRSFVGPGALADLVPALWKQQVQEWPMLAEGLAAMRQARRRSFEVDGQ